MKITFPGFRAITMIVAVSLAACSSTSPKYGMDKATRDHPATQRFLDFAAKAKVSESFDELVPDFYTLQNQQRIAKALGWARFVYSAPYTVLKDGNCEKIKLAHSGSRTHIDCTGRMIVRSMFLGDNEEQVHLRVYMVKQQGKWFFDKSGYVYTSSTNGPVTLQRGGIKFDSELDR